MTKVRLLAAAKAKAPAKKAAKKKQASEVFIMGRSGFQGGFHFWTASREGTPTLGSYFEVLAAALRFTFLAE